MKIKISTIKYILTTSIVISVNYLQAQHTDNLNVVPPSPNAFSFIEASNVSVNDYTGTPNIYIPIYSLEGKNVQIPVNVNYNASGIKVQDIATLVGLGWNLNAGGVITRIVNGLPDEDVNGYCGENGVGTKINDYMNSDRYEKLLGKEWDGEPDIFYFNFLGRSGKFFVTDKGKFVLASANGIKIESDICNGQDNGWVITDENGIKYRYGLTSSSREITSSKLSTQDDNQKLTFTSSWYLSEIEFPNSDEKIEFTYKTGSAVSYKYYSESQAYFLDSNTNDPLPDYNGDINTEIEITNPVYLTKIKTSLGYANFETVLGRSDLANAQKLNTIKFYNHDNQLLETFYFNYSYFKSGSCTSTDCYRLKLNYIQVNDSKYSFDYNDLELPPRYSDKIDHWGYYNTNTANTKIPMVTYDGENYPGADKSPNETRSQACILTKITYPTGGYTNFNYEGHDYYDGSNTYSLGGVRIQSKEVNDGAISTTTSYSYVDASGKSSGTLYNIPKYDYDFQNITIVPPSGYYYISFLKIYGMSLNEIFDLNGYHVGYSRVIEKVDGIGETEKVFTNYENHPDEDPKQYYYWDGNIGDIDINSPPFAPKTSYSQDRGLLDYIIYYDQNGDKVYKKDYTYDFDDEMEQRIKGYRTTLTETYNTSSPKLRVGEYYVVSKKTDLSKIAETIYNNGWQLTKNTEYTYNNYYQISSVTKSTKDFDEKLITKFKYPTDPKYIFLAGVGGATASGEVDAITSMANNNILSSVIEETNWIENNGERTLVSGSLNTFKKIYISDLSRYVYVPDKVYLNRSGVTEAAFEESYVDNSVNVGEFAFDGGYELSGQYDTYDGYANPTKYSSIKNGLTTSYTWGYNNSLVTSSTLNSDSNNKRTTSFEHKPLVGATKITDPNGVAATYAYDDFNRLKYIKDDDGNITERYTYHYKNVSSGLTSGLSGNIGYEGLPVVGEQLEFKAASTSNNIGKSKYIWDFGDGEVSETFSNNINHIYNSSGTKNLKLVIDNPDYNSIKEVNMPLSVYDSPAALIVCASIISRDLCTGDEVSSNCLVPSPPNSTIVPVNISFSNGAHCGSLDFNWKWRLNGGSWHTLSFNDPAINFAYATQVGTYEVSCTATDDCSNTYTGSTTINIYKSDPNCSGSIGFQN